MGKVKAYAIKNQWINLSLYFLNFMYVLKNKDTNNRVCEHLVKKTRLRDNNNPIGGKVKNNVFLANGDNIKTDFIEINKNDLLVLFEEQKLGFVKEKLSLNGSYKRQNNPGEPIKNVTNQERENNDPAIQNWNNSNWFYFLKGLNTKDIIRFLVNSKII